MVIRGLLVLLLLAAALTASGCGHWRAHHAYRSGCCCEPVPACPCGIGH